MIAERTTPGCVTPTPQTLDLLATQVLELLLMRWPGEAAALLQECLLRLLALVLAGRETSLVVAGASPPFQSFAAHLLELNCCGRGD